MPYLFQGYPSNFEVTRDKKSPILTRIECFQTVTPVGIHQGVYDYAKSLMQSRRGALSFFEVIHQISRSHGLKHRQFESNLSKITRPVAAIKSLRFALLYFFYLRDKNLLISLIRFKPDRLSGFYVFHARKNIKKQQEDRI